MTTEIRIAGAGVAGLTTAYALARRGAKVRVFEARDRVADNRCSWFAGGMLAPYCERESAEEEVLTLGRNARDWWAQVTEVTRLGTLVVTPPRDRADLTRFAKRTECHETLDRAALELLEPTLAERFDSALFYAEEAHLDPRRALSDLAKAATDLGAVIEFGAKAPEDVDIDCRGLPAGLPGLRPVRGEMAVIEAPEVEISRTVRLLHPRIPLYLVPRGGGRYMIGATMIESSSERPASLRSLLELLGAAFTLHPAFGEASVLETGVGLRPAYADNLPRITRHGGRIQINGFHRHGFLLAPALAEQVAAELTEGAICASN